MSQRKSKARANDATRVKAAPPVQAGPAAPTTDAVPEVSDADIAFPTRFRELLPKREEMTSAEWGMRGPFCDAVSGLFYRGGTLEKHGVRVRDGVDAKKVLRYLRATLGDFGPSHEHKIGGIGHMLAKWCEVIPKGATP